MSFKPTTKGNRGIVMLVLSLQDLVASRQPIYHTAYYHAVVLCSYQKNAKQAVAREKRSSSFRIDKFKFIGINLLATCSSRLTTSIR
jgi:hypothetical protein